MNDKEIFDHNIGWQNETVAERYDQRRFSSVFGRAFDSMEKRAIAKLLQFANSKHSINSVLDVPCGTGRISELLVGLNVNLTCADISEQMIDVAKARLSKHSNEPQEYAVMDIYNIDRDDGSYDCITCIRLFQHLDSDERARALRELSRVTRKYVVVNVMYGSGYYGFIRRIRKLVGAYAPRFAADRRELERELKAGSLRLVKSIFSQPFYGGNLILLLEKE